MEPTSLLHNAESVGATYFVPVWPENSIYLKQREIIPGVVDNETTRCQSAWTRSAFC